MTEPEWLLDAAVIAVHKWLIAEHGGADGLRDRGLLESALAKPRNRWLYEGADMPTLAAAYAYGLSKNHCFVDGNKRIAFTAAAMFLDLNELRLIATEIAAVTAMLKLAASESTEVEFAAWIAANSQPKQPPTG